MEIVFVGQCEVFVSLVFFGLFLFPLFFPWPLIGPRMGCQFFKNVDFSGIYPLKGVSSIFARTITFITCEDGILVSPLKSTAFIF